MAWDVRTGVGCLQYAMQHASHELMAPDSRAETHVERRDGLSGKALAPRHCCRLCRPVAPQYTESQHCIGR